jgi:aldehyde:ferredoxin oxidoreductase
VIKTLETAGHKITSDKLEQLGIEILREKNQFKIREGFDPNLLRIPSRIFEIISPLGDIDEKYIRESVTEFYKLLNI